MVGWGNLCKRRKGDLGQGSGSMKQLNHCHCGSAVCVPYLKQTVFPALFYNVLLTLKNAQFSLKKIYRNCESEFKKLEWLGKQNHVIFVAKFRKQKNQLPAKRAQKNVTAGRFLFFHWQH